MPSFDQNRERPDPAMPEGILFTGAQCLDTSILGHLHEGDVFRGFDLRDIRARLYAISDEGTTNFFTSESILGEMYGMRLDNPANFFKQIKFLKRITGGTIILPVEQRIKQELKKGGKLEQSEWHLVLRYFGRPNPY